MRKYLDRLCRIHDIDLPLHSNYTNNNSNSSNQEPVIIPAIIIGLQSDEAAVKKDAATVIQERNELIKIAQEYNIKYFETSAKTGYNVEVVCKEALKAAIKVKMVKERFLSVKQQEKNCTVQ